MKCRALSVSFAAFMLLPGFSLADNVRVENENGSDVFVTVSDLNQSGNPVITNPPQQRLNNGQAITVPAQLDGSDRYHLHWRGVQADDSSKTKEDDCEGSSTDPCRINLF